MVEANQDAYHVPFTYKKVFNTETVTEMVNAFKSYDTNHNGTIDCAEFKAALHGMGHREITDTQVAEMLAKVDKNADGVIEWVEFLDLMQIVKKSGAANVAAALITSSGQAASQSTGVGGGHHTYLLEEVSMIARTINYSCKDDALLAERLPINPDNDDLFHACSDGMVLIHMLNHIQPDSIDMRTVNKGSTMNVYKVRENLNQAFAIMQTLIKVVAIDGTTFLDKTPHLMLGVLWQLVRLLSMKSISLGECPELYRLLNEGEELTALLKLKAEEILIRWMNFHLVAAGQEKITNLGSDLKDSRKLIYVLNQLDSAHCTLDALQEADDLERATKMIASSKAIGVEDAVGPRDLVKGNAKVNSVFVAAIFNCKHGLQVLTAVEQEAFDAAGLIDDDIAGSREERVYRLWINSFQIENCFIENLFEEVRDGLVILRVCSRIEPSSVDWTKPNMTPKNIFHTGHNCDLAEQAMKKIGVKCVGVGAPDIRDGHKKNILAMIWQLMRLHYLRIIGSKTENDLIAWVNSVVQPTEPIANFGDSQFSDGKILIKLAADIEPRIVNWDLVTEGVTDGDKEMNAKYAISIARKLGAIIFLVWDDIPKLNKKMLLIFVCSLYDLKHNIA